MDSRCTEPDPDQPGLGHVHQFYVPAIRLDRGADLLKYTPDAEKQAPRSSGR